MNTKPANVGLQFLGMILLFGGGCWTIGSAWDGFPIMGILTVSIALGLLIVGRKR